MSRAILALGLFFTPLLASADVLIIDEVRQVERMDVPENGLSKAEVEAKFGLPITKHDAIGNPPITRWDFDGYAVYFEYDLVLFTVLNAGRVIDKS